MYKRIRVTQTRKLLVQQPTDRPPLHANHQLAAAEHSSALDQALDPIEVFKAYLVYCFALLVLRPRHALPFVSLGITALPMTLVQYLLDHGSSNGEHPPMPSSSSMIDFEIPNAILSI